MFPHAYKGSPNSGNKVFFCFVFTTMPVRFSHEFFFFRNKEGTEKIWINFV